MREPALLEDTKESTRLFANSSISGPFSSREKDGVFYVWAWDGGWADYPGAPMSPHNGGPGPFQPCMKTENPCREQRP